jgi:hypothetical protein
MSDRMIHTYASKTWTEIVAAALKGTPAHIESPDIVNPPSIQFAARCDGPTFASLTIPQAQRFLKRANKGRGYLATKLTRLNGDGREQHLCVYAIDKDGNEIACIGHDGKGFDIVG